MDGAVSMVLGDNQLLAESGATRMISRLVEGNFPDYQGIIPADFTTSAHLSRAEITAGVRASGIFSSKLQEATLRLGQKQIEVFSANPEVGEYRTRLAAAINGKDIAMSFNWRYLLDGIQALEEEEIFFGCNQEASPALLRNKSRADFTYVVMPIRVT
jgi:DNA polymerase-3 subunit beta